MTQTIDGQATTTIPNAHGLGVPQAWLATLIALLAPRYPSLERVIITAKSSDPDEPPRSYSFEAHHLAAAAAAGVGEDPDQLRARLVAAEAYAEQMASAADAERHRVTIWRVACQDALDQVAELEADAHHAEELKATADRLAERLRAAEENLAVHTRERAMLNEKLMVAKRERAQAEALLNRRPDLAAPTTGHGVDGERGAEAARQALRAAEEARAVALAERDEARQALAAEEEAERLTRAAADDAAARVEAKNKMRAALGEDVDLAATKALALALDEKLAQERKGRAADTADLRARWAEALDALDAQFEPGDVVRVANGALMRDAQNAVVLPLEAGQVGTVMDYAGNQAENTWCRFVGLDNSVNEGFVRTKYLRVVRKAATPAPTLMANDLALAAASQAPAGAHPAVALHNYIGAAPLDVEALRGWLVNLWWLNPRAQFRAALLEVLRTTLNQVGADLAPAHLGALMELAAAWGDDVVALAAQEREAALVDAAATTDQVSAALRSIVKTRALHRAKHRESADRERSGAGWLALMRSALDRATHGPAPRWDAVFSDVGALALGAMEAVVWGGVERLGTATWLTAGPAGLVEPTLPLAPPAITVSHAVEVTVPDGADPAQVAAKVAATTGRLLASGRLDAEGRVVELVVPEQGTAAAEGWRLVEAPPADAVDWLKGGERVVYTSDYTDGEGRHIAAGTVAKVITHDTAAHVHVGYLHIAGHGTFPVMDTAPRAILERADSNGGR